MILAFCGGALSSVLDFLDDLAQTGGLSQSVVTPVVKTAGIAVVTENRSGNLPGRPRRRTGWNRGDGRNLCPVTAVPLLTAVLSTLEGLL